MTDNEIAKEFGLTGVELRELIRKIAKEEIEKQKNNA